MGRIRKNFEQGPNTRPRYSGLSKTEDRLGDQQPSLCYHHKLSTEHQGQYQLLPRQMQKYRDPICAECRLESEC